MIVLPYLVFLATCSLDLLASRNMVPRQVSWLPEILSGLALVLVMLHGAMEKRLMIPGKYLLLFFFMGILLTISLIINDVQPGTIFIGARAYLKYFPFFLLPIVYRYTEEQLRKQLLLLMVIGVVQLPLALLQRFVIYADWGTGDIVTGTFGTSGILTIILVCYIAVLTGMYLRQKLSLAVTAALMIAFIIPIGIDETKVTVLLLPMAVGLPFLLMPDKKKNMKKIVPAVLAGGVVFVIFIFVYQAVYSSRGDLRGGGIMNFLTDPHMVQHYLYGGAAESKNIKGIDRDPPPVGLAQKPEEERASRSDGIIVAWKVLSADVVRLLVGVGMGNVMDSYLGPKFSGKYAYYGIEYAAYKTDVAMVLWELGLLGLFMIYAFMTMLIVDSVALSKSPALFGALAQGWVGVVAIIAATMLYHNNIVYNPVGYLFWFFSGHIVAARFRQSWEMAGDGEPDDQERNSSRNFSVRSRI